MGWRTIEVRVQSSVQAPPSHYRRSQQHPRILKMKVTKDSMLLSMPRRTILDAHVHNGVGPSVTVKPWSARLFYSVQCRSDDPLAHPRGHRKSRIATQCRIAEHGGGLRTPDRFGGVFFPTHLALLSPLREGKRGLLRQPRAQLH